MPTTPKPANPPAFPQDRQFDDTYAELRGMTLRDYFAAAALTALLTNKTPDLDYLLRAEVCYRQADAMLEAREG